MATILVPRVDQIKDRAEDIGTEEGHNTWESDEQCMVSDQQNT